MKIALLFSGLYAPQIKNKEVQLNEQVPNKYCDLAEKFYKKYLINCENEVDCFIHTFSTEYKSYLIDTYKPKKYLFEKQIIFSDDTAHIHPCYNVSPIQCLLSKAYSSKKVIELVNNYEKEYNFVYDFYLLTRFDVVWLSKIDFSQFNKIKNEIIVSSDNKYNDYLIYNGYLEHFILCKNKIINKWSMFYDFLIELKNKNKLQNNNKENMIFHYLTDKFIKYNNFELSIKFRRFKDNCLLRNIFRNMKHNNYYQELMNII